MRRLTLLLSILLFTAATAVLHITAIDRFWYWHYLWLDTLTHFLGGVVAGLVGAGIAYGVFCGRVLKSRLLFVVLFALGVGIVWEIFEVWAGVPIEANYKLDTSIDLLMDTFGALAAVGAVRYFVGPSAK